MINPNNAQLSGVEISPNELNIYHLHQVWSFMGKFNHPSNFHLLPEAVHSEPHFWANLRMLQYHQIMLFLPIIILEVHNLEPYSFHIYIYASPPKTHMGGTIYIYIIHTGHLTWQWVKPLSCLFSPSKLLPSWRERSSCSLKKRSSHQVGWPTNSHLIGWWHIPSLYVSPHPSTAHGTSRKKSTRVFRERTAMKNGSLRSN